jgi:inorganic pyrophosphatase
MVSDGDPLDICVLTEKTIAHGDILLTAIPKWIQHDGGKPTTRYRGDEDDAAYGISRYWRLSDLGNRPAAALFRLQAGPGSVQHKVEITSVYGREEAMKVILASHADYRKKFPELESLWPKHMSV